jgi:hypothetical protein
MRKQILVLSSAFLAILLATATTVQADPACGPNNTNRVFYVTTLEPETVREGTLEPATWQGRSFEPIPDDAAYPPGGYIQRFTPNSSNASPGSSSANKGEWTFARYAWSQTSMIVNAGDCVGIEFYGVVGTKHNSQLFRGVLSTLGNRPSDEGLPPLTGCDIDDPSDPFDPAVCSFSVNRGELTTVYFDAGAPGNILLHCGTHGPTMNANITVR